MEELGNDHWRSIFNIEKTKGTNKTFTGTIETDGIAVCMHFMKPIVTNVVNEVVINPL